MESTKKDKNGELIKSGDKIKLDGYEGEYTISYGKGTYDMGEYTYLGWILTNEKGQSDGFGWILNEDSKELEII